MMDKKQYEQSQKEFEYALYHADNVANELFDLSSTLGNVKGDDGARALSNMFRAMYESMVIIRKNIEKMKESFYDKDPEKAHGCGEHEYQIGLVINEPTIKVRADSPEQAFTLAKGLINGQDVIDFENLDFNDLWDFDMHRN